MKKITQTLILILFTITLIVPFNASYAAESEVNFQTDTDWTAWVKQNVVLSSSIGGTLNSGLTLNKLTTGKVESPGAIVYKISPGYLAQWTDFSIDADALSPTAIDFSFSAQEITIGQSFSDLRMRSDVKTNPRDVGSSDFLFVRADFTGNNASSPVGNPVLRSLKVRYNQIKSPTVYIEKRIYRYDDNDPVKLLETSTFTPGQRVAVSIKLSAQDAGDMNFAVKDFFSRKGETIQNIVDLADAQKYCALKTTDQLLGGEFSNSTDSVQYGAVNLNNVTGYLCYTYYVPSKTDPVSKWQSKNDVQQVRTNVFYNNSLVASSNNYLMVRGFAYEQSDSASPTLTNTLPIDDELLFNFDKLIFKGLSGQDILFASSPSYIYKRGLASRSRGGNLYSLPVSMTDNSGEVTFSSESFYLLYNPSVYITGNVFSKNGVLGAAIDFGSRSNAISGSAYDANKKLNAQASLYNYSLDQSSIAYWDTNNSQKNQAMSENIKNIVGTESKRPENFCLVSDMAKLSSGHKLYLDNEQCNIEIATTDSVWPNGRVWYFKPSGDVNLAATTKKSGTLVFDFANAPNSTLNINTRDTDFASNANLGIILINGGNVQFGDTCTTFNGLIFAPGNSTGQGAISFKDGGAAVKIRGSLVGNSIVFAPRNKSGQQYAVTIFADQKVLAANLPGFGTITQIVSGSQ